MTRVNSISFGQSYLLHCRNEQHAEQVAEKLHGTKIQNENQILLIPPHDWEVMQNIAKAAAETRDPKNSFSYNDIYDFRMQNLMGKARDHAFELLV